jgi:hypothetical protein
MPSQTVSTSSLGSMSIALAQICTNTPSAFIETARYSLKKMAIFPGKIYIVFISFHYFMTCSWQDFLLFVLSKALK